LLAGDRRAEEALGGTVVAQLDVHPGVLEVAPLLRDVEGGELHVGGVGQTDGQLGGAGDGGAGVGGRVVGLLAGARAAAGGEEGGGGQGGGDGAVLGHGLS